MRTWTTEMRLPGVPKEILELLTEPEAIASWAPIPFELVEIDGDRLEAGTRARVFGELAGRGLEFDVEVFEASDERLCLTASGPVSIDAEYELRPADGGSDVRASVSVSGRGRLGKLLALGVEALLAGGALRQSVMRLGAQLELEGEPELALAA